jgi:hypothetical protein
VTGDPEHAVGRNGKVVVVTPCDCRAEIALDRAQVRTPRWQACLSCERRWLLYVLGSERVLWSEICAAPQPIRPRRGMCRVWRWRR